MIKRKRYVLINKNELPRWNGDGKGKNGGRSAQYEQRVADIRPDDIAQSHIAATIDSRRYADKQFGRRSAHAYNGETNDKIAEMRFFGYSHRRVNEHISAQK